MRGLDYANPQYSFDIARDANAYPSSKTYTYTVIQDAMLYFYGASRIKSIKINNTTMGSVTYDYSINFLCPVSKDDVIEIVTYNASDVIGNCHIFNYL